MKKLLVFSQNGNDIMDIIENTIMFKNIDKQKHIIGGAKIVVRLSPCHYCGKNSHYFCIIW